ncbi:probable APS3 - AP-3 complex subunit, sigma3 subunit [Melanopsichium pennsylvanicum]|uniref:Probable APS3 - AP-3 complex subunit, sigma3 subunit n=2 Tax=Melanopsichium pennsylvanicum TaxID=63383 RepID=A0AAJ5C3A4_9BASI|nr:probable APS3-AP-3 complex subunit, sigma3 subunit [Melanopsichium pennsylvanicum 4]SNX82411.1 probable APS3 - AP-3 complex subunit, sigma3 subunit [Melanopsichium pennsylvanicum]
MTIRAALIVNNHGKPRLTKFYTQLPASRQQALIKEIFRLVSKRPDGVCNFLDATELTALLPPPADAVQFKGKSITTTTTTTIEKNASTNNPASELRKNEDQLRVIYRHYATLYFVFVVDSSESELGILDLIQVFVESLDRCFENVCELDLIFHFDQVHAILNEVIQGGLVVETNIIEIVAAAQATSRARKDSAASAGGVGGPVGSALGNLTPAGLNLALPGTGSGGGGFPWPKGTFMVDAISNLGNQYLGRSSVRR